MRLVTTKLGGLTCRVLNTGANPAGGGRSPELAAVLCHGYGAPGNDLVGLGAELLRLRPDLVGRVRFVFPEAPIALGGLGFGPFDSRAWWSIDVERFAEIASRGDWGARNRSGPIRTAPGTSLDDDVTTSTLSEDPLAALQREVPAGLDTARRLLAATVDEVLRHLDLPVSRLVLGGFSQGAMLATDLTLRLEEAPALLAIFSGTLICADEWRRRAPVRAGLKVLQSHARQDPMLPYFAAEQLRELLVGAGLAVDFIPFDGSHTISPIALGALAARLATLGTVAK